MEEGKEEVGGTDLVYRSRRPQRVIKKELSEDEGRVRELFRSAISSTVDNLNIAMSPDVILKLLNEDDDENKLSVDFRAKMNDAAFLLRHDPATTLRSVQVGEVTVPDGFKGGVSRLICFPAWKVSENMVSRGSAFVGEWMKETLTKVREDMKGKSVDVHVLSTSRLCLREHEHVWMLLVGMVWKQALDYRHIDPSIAKETLPKHAMVEELIQSLLEAERKRRFKRVTRFENGFSNSVRRLIRFPSAKPNAPDGYESYSLRVLYYPKGTSFDFLGEHQQTEITRFVDEEEANLPGKGGIRAAFCVTVVPGVSMPGTKRSGTAVCIVRLWATVPMVIRMCPIPRLPCGMKELQTYLRSVVDISFGFQEGLWLDVSGDVEFWKSRDVVSFRCPRSRLSHVVGHILSLSIWKKRLETISGIGLWCVGSGEIVQHAMYPTHDAAVWDAAEIDTGVAIICAAVWGTREARRFAEEGGEKLDSEMQPTSGTSSIDMKMDIHTKREQEGNGDPSDDGDDGNDGNEDDDTNSELVVKRREEKKKTVAPGALTVKKLASTLKERSAFDHVGGPTPSLSRKFKVDHFGIHPDLLSQESRDVMWPSPILNNVLLSGEIPATSLQLLQDWDVSHLVLVHGDGLALYPNSLNYFVPPCSFPAIFDATVEVLESVLSNSDQKVLIVGRCGRNLSAAVTAAWYLVKQVGKVDISIGSKKLDSREDVMRDEERDADVFEGEGEGEGEDEKVKAKTKGRDGQHGEEETSKSSAAVKSAQDEVAHAISLVSSKRGGLSVSDAIMHELLKWWCEKRLINL